MSGCYHGNEKERKWNKSGKFDHLTVFKPWEMFNFFEQASLIDVPDVATAERTQGCCRSEQAVHTSSHTLMFSTWQTAFPNCLPKSCANLHARGKV